MSNSSARQSCRSTRSLPRALGFAAVSSPNCRGDPCAQRPVLWGGATTSKTTLVGHISVSDILYSAVDPPNKPVLTEMADDLWPLSCGSAKRETCYVTCNVLVGVYPTDQAHTLPVHVRALERVHARAQSAVALFCLSPPLCPEAQRCMRSPGPVRLQNHVGERHVRTRELLFHHKFLVDLNGRCTALENSR